LLASMITLAFDVIDIDAEVPTAGADLMIISILIFPQQTSVDIIFDDLISFSIFLVFSLLPFFFLL